MKSPQPIRGKNQVYNWVGCDKCLRWYAVCVGMKCTSEQYMCQMCEWETSYYTPFKDLLDYLLHVI